MEEITGVCNSSSTWKLWGQAIYKACGGSLTSLEEKGWRAQFSQLSTQDMLEKQEGLLALFTTCNRRTDSPENQTKQQKEAQGLIISVEHTQETWNAQLLWVSWHQGVVWIRGVEELDGLLGKMELRMLHLHIFLMSLDLERSAVTIAGGQSPLDRGQCKYITWGECLVIDVFSLWLKSIHVFDCQHSPREEIQSLLWVIYFIRQVLGLANRWICMSRNMYRVEYWEYFSG